MIPRFETEQDLINEREVIDRWLPQGGGYRAVKLGEYDIDFKIVDDKGNTLAYAEVKCFTCMPNTYKVVVISERKLNKLQSTGKLNTYFIVRYANGEIRYICVTDIRGEKGIISRKKKRVKAVNDKEPCLRIPNELFKTLNR